MSKYFIVLLLTGCSHNYMLFAGNNHIKQCYVPALVFSSGLDKQTQNLVNNSFNHWNDVANKKLFIYGGSTNINPEDPKAIAITTVSLKEMPTSIITSRKISVSEKRHCIVGAKVYINKSALSNPMLETSIRKEAGYILGLSSSPDFTSLMYGGLEPTQQHPVDANDKEIEEIKTIYEVF